MNITLIKFNTNENTITRKGKYYIKCNLSLVCQISPTPFFFCYEPVIAKIHFSIMEKISDSKRTIHFHSNMLIEALIVHLAIAFLRANMITVVVVPGGSAPHLIKKYYQILH